MSLSTFLVSLFACFCIVGSAARGLYNTASSITDQTSILERIIWNDRSIDAGALNFTPCFPTPANDTNQAHWQCGYLDVPLDYTNASDSRTARIALVMYQAGETKSNRTIVVNPGGPGASGTQTAWFYGEKWSKDYSDGTFDVLGFDPRGINMSVPSSSCYNSDAYRDRWSSLAFQVPDTVSNGDLDVRAGQKALNTTDLYFQAIWGACEQRNGDFSRFITTAFVSRDVDRLREALGEEELTAIVFSYGTNLMQTYAAMFPQRVGRIILDGVQSARLARSPFGWGNSTDGNALNSFYEGFLGGCTKAGPDLCELAELNGTVQTSESLKGRVNEVLAELRKLPQAAWHPELGAGLVTYESLVNILFTSMYSPGSWSRTAKMLKGLLEGNNTLTFAAHEWQYDPVEGDTVHAYSWPGIEAPQATTAELIYQIVCADSYDYKREPWNYWLDFYQAARNRSWIWPDSFFQVILACRTYNNSFGPPKEVYRGNFTAKLKNPLLLVGGTHDPVTPIFNVRLVQDEWGKENIRTVLHHGYGHTAIKDPSNCTESIKRDVILNGKWPGPDEERECFADQKPFEKHPAA
ncbi:hypothetical protein OC846_005555 [Tilletia horrida]|uniref:AB hydrolase-1 domain-containing protein n=1 Tax=Tilletia horrida TaxID=155126 RepID=A0AAN6GQB9_9BASI|nr:hypothetical protein OC846_005555 [Tilletia horrida]